MQRKSRIGWPHPLRFSKGGIPRKREAMFVRHRQQTYSPPNILLCPHACIAYGSGYLHFITTSCYHRRPMLGTVRRRNLFLKIFEQVRVRYGFVVVGYVVMAEHIHLLISEPDHGTPSTVMQVLKQRFA